MKPNTLFLCLVLCVVVHVVASKKGGNACKRKDGVCLKKKLRSNCILKVDDDKCPTGQCCQKNGAVKGINMENNIDKPKKQKKKDKIKNDKKKKGEGNQNIKGQNNKLQSEKKNSLTNNTEVAKGEKTFCKTADCKLFGGICKSEMESKTKYCKKSKIFQDINCLTCYCCHDHDPPTPSCKQTYACSNQGGHCVIGHCTGTLTDHCEGHGCQCCIPVTTTPPPPCSNQRKCGKKGNCKAKCNSKEYVSSYKCTEVACKCCNKCKPKSKCKNVNGKCRTQCKAKEHELPKGCKGYGCKCCYKDNCPIDLDKKCTKKYGECKSKKECKKSKGKFTTKFCKKDKKCGCCLPGCKQHSKCKKQGGKCEKKCKGKGTELLPNCCTGGCKCCKGKCKRHSKCKKQGGKCKEKCEGKETELLPNCCTDGCKCCKVSETTGHPTNKPPTTEPPTTEPPTTEPPTTEPPTTETPTTEPPTTETPTTEPPTTETPTTEPPTTEPPTTETPTTEPPTTETPTAEPSCDYSQFTTDHTMLLSTTSPCDPHMTGVTEEEITVILELHNTLRAQVANGQESIGDPGPQPTAANMRELVWNDELAKVAQAWAHQCASGHDCSDCRKICSRSYSVGQNIFTQWTFSASSAWRKAINGWYSEVKDMPSTVVDSFTSSTAKGVIGHYTQLVWADTNEVGCGAIQYSTVLSGTTYPESKKYVCNYGKAGNWLNSPVYEQGTAASNCANGVSTNYPGLCL